MPPTKVGPLPMNVMERSIRDAIAEGRQHRHYNRGWGTYLDTAIGRRRLQKGDGSLTDAGRIYFGNIFTEDGVVMETPTFYRCDQELINDRFVETYKGKTLQVRKWGTRTNDWVVTRQGENYFKYNRDSYNVAVPTRMLVV